MKSIRRPAGKNKEAIPDLSRRPHRIHLEQFVEVEGFSRIKLRAIELADEGKMIDFHLHLSPRSIFLRYFGYIGLDRRTSHERLIRVCTNTAEVYSIVMEQPAHPGTSVKILAVGRLIKTPEPQVAMFDILIGNEADIPKLATILLNRLIKLGQSFRFQILAGKLLGIDEDAIKLFRSLGFAEQNSGEEGVVQVVLKL